MFYTMIRMRPALEAEPPSWLYKLFKYMKLLFIVIILISIGCNQCGNVRQAPLFNVGDRVTFGYTEEYTGVILSTPIRFEDTWKYDVGLRGGMRAFMPEEKLRLQSRMNWDAAECPTIAPKIFLLPRTDRGT
jgi:hypothetical protein